MNPPRRVVDNSSEATDLSPLQEQRAWDLQAQNNVVEKLQAMGLIAPKGEIDKVLETVVNNLEVTNNLTFDPEVHCRVLMTSTIESFTLGRTIVLSRGLIDVCRMRPVSPQSWPRNWAMSCSTEQWTHGSPSTIACCNSMRKRTFQHFDFERTQKENAAASAKAAELLKNSPYKDQLGTAEAFIADLQKLSREIPNLISPRLGDSGILKLPVAGTQNETAARHIVALPLGGRVKLDPWNDTLALLKSQPVTTITDREKMPFEITPFVIYLTRETSEKPKISQPTLARQSPLEPGSKSTTANVPSPQAENAPPPGPGSVAAPLKETSFTTPPSPNVNQPDGARAASTAEPESSLPPKSAGNPGVVKPSVSVSFSFYPSILVPAGLRPQTSGQAATLHVGQLLSRVDPVYPEDAETQQMEGTVELHAIIGQDGTVQSVEPKSGPGLLVAAAANAVRKWRYTPSSIGGQPVEAEEDVTVTFRLLKQAAHPN